MNFTNDRPIYMQLVEQIQTYIVSGKIKPGERLPSVRDFALKFQVNPNTMQKALSTLEEDNLIYTERTNGKYVTENQQLIETIKTSLANEKVKNYLNDMENIGLSKTDAIRYLQELGGKK